VADQRHYYSREPTRPTTNDHTQLHTNHTQAIRQHAFRSGLYVSPTFPPSAHAQAALTKLTAGTNPIHNKKPKKKVVEEDDEDKAYKLKAAAGMLCCNTVWA
jgi:hypothetical protein